MNEVQNLDLQEVGNMLSAEAKVFVPRQHQKIADGVENSGAAPPATGGAPCFTPDGAIMPMSETDKLGVSSMMSSQPVNGVVQDGLPGYITTCYPFVTGDNRVPARGKYPQMASPQVPQFETGLPQTRFPAHNKNFVPAWNQAIPMMQGLIPQFTPNLPNGMATNFPNGMSRLPNGVTNAALPNGVRASTGNNGLPNGLSNACLTNTGAPNGVANLPNGMPFDGGTDLGDGLLPTPVIIPSFPVHDDKSVIHQRQLMFNSDWSMKMDCDTYENNVLTAEEVSPWSHYQTWAGGDQVIGQQDGLLMPPNPAPLDCQKICLRHASVQTDFPEELANSTLEEVPNSLFGTHHRRPSHKQRHKNRTRHKGQGHTSESDIDSDSGYSSTLHRKNQVSNGTNPACHQATVTMETGTASSNHVTSMQNNVPLEPVELKQGRMSYAAIAQHVASQKQHNSVAMVTNCDKTVCDTSNINKKGMKCNGKLSFNNVTVNVACLMKDLESALEEKMDFQEADPADQGHSGEIGDPDTGLNQGDGKKKRKRTRRRKKKSGEGGNDVGVDDLSSSTPGATMETDINLHFEDEEEFPDLASSASAIQQSSPSKGVVSYSDILKAKSVQSPAVPDPVCVPAPAPPLSLSSNPASLQLDNIGANAKESRTSRKRRRRREVANKAAEAEMAEINLEQHMLELKMKQKQPLSAKKSVSPVRNPATQGPWKLAAGSPSSQQSSGKKVSLKLPATVAQEPISMGIKQPTGAMKQAGILKTTPQQHSGGKKSKQPMALDFGAMIDALEVKREAAVPQAPPPKPKAVVKKEEGRSFLNSLDSTAPTVKRGKERETPRPKKPSPLKKVILKEREEKKRLRMLDEDDPSGGTDLFQPSTFPNTPISAPVGIGVVDGESDLSQDASSSRGSMEVGLGTPASAELSPISQTSPISMSPLSPGPSPLSSGVNSPIANNVQVKLKIHSRRFREYCNQVLDKEIDNCCVNLLQDLVRFQDRQYHKDPVKAKARRRVVLGLREVTKHLKLKKIKCVIISPNLEKIQSKGGLDDALNAILELCSEQQVPFIFALGRRALGRACAKLVPVSVVGIFNYEGSEENFKRLVDLTEKAREQYREMISQIEKEMLENPPRFAASSSASAVPHLFPAHMGHSRTPSGCSVISFTSSILSEPISENYPYSEPETDSKGYEIVKKPEENVDRSITIATTDTTSRSQYNASNSDFDPGNEADDESGNDANPKKIQPQVVNDDTDSESESESDDDMEESEEENDDKHDDMTGGRNDVELDSNHNNCLDDSLSLEGSDTVNDLPHIDSIHNLPLDLSTEILSQHSTRTLESWEVLSTHSSKTTHSSRTFGDGSSTILGDTCKSNIEHVKNELTKNSENTNLTLKGKNLDKDHRIQSWVNESTSQLQQLHIKDQVEHNKDLENNREDCLDMNGVAVECLNSKA